MLIIRQLLTLSTAFAKMVEYQNDTVTDTTRKFKSLEEKIQGIIVTYVLPDTGYYFCNSYMYFAIF